MDKSKLMLNDDLRKRIDRLVNDTTLKDMSEEIKSILNKSVKDDINSPLSLQDEINLIIERCKSDPQFYKELKAQLRELRGLPR